MKALCLVAVLVLVGCNKADGGDPFPQPPLPSPPDAFYTMVLAQIAVSPEDSDAGSVENLAATAPEDSEPQMP